MGKKRKPTKIDEAFMGGVLASLDIVTLHDQETVWREIVESACDPLELARYAGREGLLEVSGFVQYAETFDRIREEEKRA